MATTDNLRFCCPKCKGSLITDSSAHFCSSCRLTFRVFFGIPDFRLFEGLYAADKLTYRKDDYRHATPLIEEFERKDFAALLRQYLEAAGVSGERFERMYANILSMTDRAVEDLVDIEKQGRSALRTNFGSLLELGCGTGSFLLAAKKNIERVVGVDMAMRWLILAKKRLAEQGLEAPLVCCYAEHLPFEEDSFDLIVAEDVIEHVQSQEHMLRESYRVIKHGGVFYLKFPNRLSLAPEPHVRVWGVGFLPRRWMNAYVHWRAAVPYENTRLLSFFETRRLLRHNSFGRFQIMIPPIPEHELRHFSNLRKRAAAVYEFMRGHMLSRALLYVFGPFFHVFAYADKSREDRS